MKDYSPIKDYIFQDYSIQDDMSNELPVLYKLEYNIIAKDFNLWHSL